MDLATESTAPILEPGQGRMHFDLERRTPAPGLAAHVERHWIVSWALPGEDPFEQEILPNPCVNLAAEPGLVAVWGIPRTRSRHLLKGSGSAVGTKFRPGGFAGFVDGPAHALNDAVVPLGRLFGAPGRRLATRLEAAQGDPAAHIEAVEAFLLERLPEPDPRFELVAAVVDDMLTGAPDTTVAALARGHAVSERTLQRAFRDYVGVSPKWVLKRYRMHVAAERIAAGEAPDAARLAGELGYFDQSHFIGDFTDQIGRTPGDYARACAAAAGRS